MTRWYLDAPVSQWSSAHDKAHRPRSTVTPIPSTASKKTAALLDRLKRRTSRSSSATSPVSINASYVEPTLAKESLFFRLPLSVRHKIYGYIVGQGELLHILLRYRSAPSRFRVAYRRCAAHGIVENCILKDCREFHDSVKGSYYGRFDHVGGLFRACKDM